MDNENYSVNSPEELETYLGHANNVWGSSLSLKLADKAR
ncbi:unnamed protein product [Nezara viridula]|uniref:Uncharacterized protein n=1 Tax=Nezara viridula TaxID=85310 RepID=A0A9P0HHQ4_NEZVI|nr:unnamed protein product [Nezara viridula]